MDLILILYLSSFVLAILSIFIESKKNNKIISLVFIIILFLISSLRSFEVGYDTIGHINYFNYARSSFYNAIYFKEPGYGLLSYLVSFFGGFRLFLAIYSLIIFLIIGFVSFKISPNPLLSISLYSLMFFIDGNLSKLRHIMSISIILLSIYYLHKGNNILFLFLVYIASKFHSAAIFFILYLLIYNKKITRKSLIIMTMISLFVHFMKIPRNIYKFILKYESFFNNIKFINFKTFFYYDEAILRSSGGTLGILYILFSLLLIIIFYKSIFNKNKNIKIINAYIFGLLISLATFDLSLILSRFSEPYFLLFIFVLPIIFHRKIYSLEILTLFTIIIVVVTIRSLSNYYEIRDMFYPFRFLLNIIRRGAII